MLNHGWVEIRLQDIELLLSPERAVFSKEHSALFVADTHFGKDATFRKNGLAVPTGGCRDVLETLLRVVEQTSAKQLFILGDMFHAPSSLSDDVLKDVSDFLNRLPNTEVKLVRGNHDRFVGKFPPAWNLDVVEPRYQLGRITLTHEPQVGVQSDGIVLCGHLHPAFRLKPIQGGAGKLPCFWWSRRNLVLPAMGKYTGTFVIEPIEDDKVWLVVENELIEWHMK